MTRFISCLSSLLIGLGLFSSLHAQNFCTRQPSFSVGQKAHAWSSWDNEWKTFTYQGKEGNDHIFQDSEQANSRMRTPDLSMIYTEREFAKLDLSQGKCARCVPSQLAYFRSESLRLLNQYRAQNGKAALKHDPVLEKAAQDYVDWCAANYSRYMGASNSHRADGTEVGDRVIAAARTLGAPVLEDPNNGLYAFKGVGENLTTGRLCSDAAFESWRGSSSHDWQMKFERHQYVGIAVACGQDPNGNCFIVAAQVFGGEKAQAEQAADGRAATSPARSPRTSGASRPSSAPASSRNPQTAPTPRRPSQPQASAQSTLVLGQEMKTNQRIYAADRSHYLVVQTDGNLVIYTRADKPIWATMTHSQGSGCRLAMQTDGHLVYYNRSGKAIWATETHPNWDSKYRSSEWKPTKAVLENDGSLVLYSATERKVWTSRQGKL